MAQVKALIGNIKGQAGKDGSENQIYSTEEQVIGKWISGKPIYRKVFSLNKKVSEGVDISTGCKLDNVDILISLSMYTDDSWGNRWVSDISNGNPIYLTQNNYINAGAYSGSRDFYYNIHMIIAEYTKTTDTATT